MVQKIEIQRKSYLALYILFGVAAVFIMTYYLSFTIMHFTTPRQFPINSFERYVLSFVIFPAEIFSLLFSVYFVYALLSDYRREKPKGELKNKSKIPVAVLLPVYNEPKEIVERTVKACKNIIWPGKLKVYLLDDSKNDEDIKNMNELAKKYNLAIIRREDRVGYKAGNLNNAIKQIKEDYFVVLDSDQAPEKEFLLETMDYFSDDSVGFVQTPQHFINDDNPISRGAKIGNDIFYRSQAVSKSKDGAIPFCGTNVVVWKKAFEEVNGFSYYTATEDIDLGIRMNELGYRGVFVPEVLVKGYAPTDFTAYSSQQYRWANGNLAILRESLPKMLGGNFNMRHQIHMLFTTGWWLIGIVTFLYILVPILSLVFGLGTHHTWLPGAMLGFLFLNAFIGIGMITASQKHRVKGESYTLGDAFMQYSLIVNSMFIYSRAAINALIFKRYIGFVTTNKRKSNSGLGLIRWNLILSGICLVFAFYGLYYASIAGDSLQFRTYLPVSLWLLFYGFVLASSIIFVGGENEG